ncbi:hypothetical protein RFI_10060 [Reticulomyxa filosa]|uniref:Uncharacterized protein n=1 Tax=Reticulomyxa filosa TaxID=46433 RepID=X6NMB5_RETFI|nr:hypothetical protein RFI_10060 [Reticulomyxa filosa]|eukprot:ETO27073.1 hypothetical protein RFI_10060 [Reticulomyxa filosa]
MIKRPKLTPTPTFYNHNNSLDDVDGLTLTVPTKEEEDKQRKTKKKIHTKKKNSTRSNVEKAPDRYITSGNLSLGNENATRLILHHETIRLNIGNVGTPVQKKRLNDVPLPSEDIHIATLNNNTASTSRSSSSQVGYLQPFFSKKKNIKKKLETLCFGMSIFVLFFLFDISLFLVLFILRLMFMDTQNTNAGAGTGRWI